MGPEYRDTSREDGDCNLLITLEDPAQPKPPKPRRLSHVVPVRYSVPQTDEQWESSRARCGLDTPANILNKLAPPKARTKLQNWQKLVIIAAATVDSSCGQNEYTAELGKIYTRCPKPRTLLKDKALVKNLIGIFDHFYAHLEHRAFELFFIWDISISTLRTWTATDFQELKSRCSHTLKPKEEMQASAPLYIPFLGSLSQPHRTLNQICAALKTNTLDQHDFDRFQKACDGQEFEPCLLGALGDYRTPSVRVAATAEQPLSELAAPSTQDDADLDSREVVHTGERPDSNFHTPISGYKVFGLSRKLQQRASRAVQRKRVCTRISKGGTRLVQFDWRDEFHLPVVDQTITELVSLSIMTRAETKLK
ncbi:hypothetical protein AK830_g4288 [Neonectria ditissima]|uniref:Uncharacterized protein n=1 Tax=Neonectria ditissima TaxID=78410 RepID=A0A0P7BP79_9HYPO|nr:hypothetical protein AK830_g4288 [Neonectria ditissima]